MNFLKSLKQLTEPQLVWKQKSYKSLKIGYFPVNYVIVSLPTNYLFNDVQISEYDITN